MNEKKKTELLHVLRTCMQWGVNFLAVYSLMVVVAAMQVGVGNGFVVLMAGMVWLGCMAADVLLGTKESEKYTRFCWIVESICLSVVMVILNPVCGLVTAVFCVIEILLKRKWNSRIMMWCGSIISAVCLSHLIMKQLQNSSAVALGLSLLVLQAVHQKKWLECNPLEYMTLQLHSEQEKEKASVMLLMSDLIACSCMIALCVLYGRFGLYAVQQKALFISMEADLMTAGIMAVICICHFLKDRYSFGDVSEQEKTAVPWMQSSLACVGLYSLWLMNFSHMIAGFSILCLLILCAVIYLVRRFTGGSSSFTKAMLAVWAMIYMVSVFLLVDLGYDGLHINVIHLGEAAAGCAMIYLHFIRGRGML